MIQFPRIIQGGMGVGVSNWRLAQAVSKLGQLGVVSGTALDCVFLRRLADGDQGGHMRRGLDAFPFPQMAKARAAGINVSLVTFSVYVISGLCVGIAALIFTSRLMAAQAISGQGFELQAIAAAVVGGASLFGGRGKIMNTIVGALIMGVLFNGFVMLDVPQPIQQMAVGIIIIVSVWLDGVLRNRRRKRRLHGR